MHCQIKVDFKTDDLELIIEGEPNSSWRATNVKEFQPHVNLKTTRQYIHIDVVRQMCDEAYKAGGSNSIKKLDSIKQILKG